MPLPVSLTTMSRPADGTTTHRETFTSMVKSKFLSKPEDLGIVAVGFSGGQVSRRRPDAPPWCTWVPASLRL